MILINTPYHINLLYSSSFFSFSTTPSLSLRRRTTISATSTSDTHTLPHFAIRRIADKLRSLGYVPDNSPPPRHLNSPSSSPGEIFLPLPTQLPKTRVAHTLDASWSTPETPVLVPGSGNAIQRYNHLRAEAFNEKEKERADRRKERVPLLTELSVPSNQLKKLIPAGIGLKQKLKIGKA